jgi:chromosome segregation ATPase
MSKNFEQLYKDACETADARLVDYNRSQQVNRQLFNEIQRLHVECEAMKAEIERLRMAGKACERAGIDLSRGEAVIADHLSEMQAQINDAENKSFELGNEVRCLRAECEGLRQDAERYRWLRNDPPTHLCVRRKEFKHGIEMLIYFDGPDLDRIVDRARSQPKDGV